MPRVATRLGTGCALGVIAFLGSACASQPAAALDRSVDRLSEARCPPRYAVLSKRAWSAEEVADARDGYFAVHGTRLRLVPPVNWHLDPYRSTAFRGALHRLSWLDVLFYAHRRGDVGALRQARALALDWIRQNKRGSRNLPPKAWVNKVAADRVPYLAYLARAAACERELSRTQARRLIRSLHGHGRFLSTPAAYSRNNHGLFVDFGLYLLGRQAQFIDDARRWRRLATERFSRTLRQRVVASEGLWLEHSAGYHWLVTTLIESFIDETRIRDPGLRALFGRMLELAGWLVEPDDDLVLLGDTNLLGGASEPLRREAADDQGLRWLPRSGLAIVKRQSPDAFLSLAAQFHNGSHKHSDELSFDLFDRGHRIVSDTGMYHKDPDRWYEFSQASRAHSTLEVDRRGFTRTSTQAYGSGLVARGAGDGWYALEGRNPLLRGRGVNHSRLLLYKPGFALIALDRVRSQRAHTYRRYVQLGPDIVASEAGDAARLSASGYLGQLTSDSSYGGGSLRLVRGQRDPLQGFIFPGFREAVPRWTAIFETRGANVDHATSISLDPLQMIQAELAGPLERERAEVRLMWLGFEIGRVRTIRDGTRLLVNATP